MELEEIYMPEGAKEQIQAILPFAYKFQLSDKGGWVICFKIREDHSNWSVDEQFLKDNNLSLTSELEEDFDLGFDRLFIRPKFINFELTYRPFF